MPTLPYYLRRVRELGLREASHQAGDILFQSASRAWGRVRDRYLRKDPTERDILRLCGFNSSADLLTHFKTRKTPVFFLADNLDSKIGDFRGRFPHEAQKIVEEADLLLAHRVELLGSGPVDLDEVKSRLKTVGYLPWHCDFKSGCQWNPKSYYKNIRYGNEPGVDVKVPWELSRFHHLIRLGQAYRLAPNEAYAREFVKQISDWMETNPPRYGVNWSSTMDVAIRAVNWIWALYLFRNSASVTPEFLLKILTSLYAHARFIRSNLEYREAWISGSKRRLNSNHYLSNIIGLLYITALFPEFRLDDDRRFSATELEIELFEETTPDGTDYEHSTSYHRLVFEMFLSGFLLLELNGAAMSAGVRDRLTRMAQFVADYLRPDGTAPQIGDSDDGRLHSFSVRDHNDHRYLAFVEGSVDPERWWWFRGEPPLLVERDRSSAGYSDAGFYIMRSAPAHVFICAATVGMHGLGSHSHNDLLSFEYSTKHGPWLVDPGTYLYTPDPAGRDLFRSTAYHNTVRIDGAEINPIPQGQLFQLSDQARVIVREWVSSADEDVLDLELNQQVCHRRRFRLEKATGTLTIQDSFAGSGAHQLEWFLHVGPAIRIRQNGLNFLLEKESGAIEIQVDSTSMQTETIEGAYSPSYGVRVPAPIIILRLTTAMPFRTQIEIRPC